MRYAIYDRPDRGHDAILVARARKTKDLPKGSHWRRTDGPNRHGKPYDMCGLPTGRWARQLEDDPYETSFRR